MDRIDRPDRRDRVARRHPSTPAEHREHLLALLEVWSESVCVDADARWRVGNVSEPSVFRSWIRDEHGATVRLFRHTGGMRVLEFRHGAAAAPGLGPLTDVVESPRSGWRDARRIRELLALVRPRGPMPRDPEAVALLVGGTGISRAAAVLLLAANPGTRSSPEPFPDREERRALGLSTIEAKLAEAEPDSLIDTERLDLFADALPANPRQARPAPRGARGRRGGPAPAVPCVRSTTVCPPIGARRIPEGDARGHPPNGRARRLRARVDGQSGKVVDHRAQHPVARVRAALPPRAATGPRASIQHGFPGERRSEHGSVQPVAKGRQACRARDLVHRGGLDAPCGLPGRRGLCRAGEPARLAAGRGHHHRATKIAADPYGTQPVDHRLHTVAGSEAKQTHAAPPSGAGRSTRHGHTCHG
ncbi:hypothetical protein [Embleya sp. MST-111070]|uniref:hypothetical protein n=1 Tax=Embleya sp. MST-111070 TaxID=3398231 RepID=UPI003F73F24E